MIIIVKVTIIMIITIRTKSDIYKVKIFGSENK